MDKPTAIVLAAGEGKRMRSRRPKVLHPLCGRPLLAYVLEAVRTVTDRIVVVVGPDGEALRRVTGPGIDLVEQKERLGTGHAVLQARDAAAGSPVLIVSGDTPLLSAATLERLVRHHATTGAAATVLTTVMPEPRGYGRILRDGSRVRGIVEERDATPEQRAITEINVGVYGFDAARLWAALAEVRADNDQGEYYLTDVIGLLVRGGARVEAVTATDPAEALGVNDRRQLATVAAIKRGRILDRLMEAGVTVLDPATTYVEDTVTVGSDTVIYPGAILEGETSVGSECVIGAGCQVTDSRIADRVKLLPYCVMTEARVDDEAILGPFCHLRPAAHIGPKAKIGNFVEVKKSKIGRGAKANHLAYIGDATVGADVNIGAGTITCNYDGLGKHETTIGDRAFVGTNSTLVAPLVIGEGAYIGGGSTITKDVPPGALAVGRAQQIVKEGWAERRARKRKGGDAG